MKREALIQYRGERLQEDMAKQYHVTQQTWSAWELGITTPSAPVMKKMEIDSGVPMEKLFFDVFDK